MRTKRYDGEDGSEGHTRALMPKMAGNDIGTQSPKRK